MSEAASGTDDSAAASVLGYLHQTRWGLLELLPGPERPIQAEVSPLRCMTTLRGNRAVRQPS